MPGKPGKIGIIENRGGRHKGNQGGRPKETLSITQVRVMLNVARQFAKKHKKSIDMVLCEFIYNEELPVRDRVACIKLWKDKTMVTTSEGGEADRYLGPATYLPEEKPDIAKIVNIDDVRDLNPS